MDESPIYGAGRLEKQFLWRHEDLEMQLEYEEVEPEFSTIDYTLHIMRENSVKRLSTSLTMLWIMI